MAVEWCVSDVQRGVDASTVPGQTGPDWGRILIADDEEAIRLCLVELLRREGYHCDCVGTAQDAVKALETNAYDLLITDVRMPDNDTLAFLDACQSGASPVPVIVITGYPSVGTAVEAVRLSVVDYLVKPVDDEALYKSVNLAIGKGRLLRSLRKAREEMRVWDEAIDRLEESLAASECANAGMKGTRSIEHVLRQTMTLFGQIVTSLKVTIETSRRDGLGQRTTDFCALVQCPKGTAYEGALRRSVEVLMNTKNSFKSKELGELRKTLAGILKKEANC